MRGTPGGETPVSRAATDEYRSEHDRIFGARPEGVRGRYVYVPALGRCVVASDYDPPLLAINAPIISDRIHEGVTHDTGEGVVDLGSRRKREAFKRETGLTDASDYGPGWRERRAAERERTQDRSTNDAVERAKRKLYQQGKWR